MGSGARRSSGQWWTAPLATDGLRSSAAFGISGATKVLALSGVGLDDAISRRLQAKADAAAWAAEDAAKAAKAAQAEEQAKADLRAQYSPLTSDFVARAARLKQPSPLGYYRGKKHFWSKVDDKWVDLGVRGWFFYLGFAVLTDARLVLAYSELPGDRIRTYGELEQVDSISLNDEGQPIFHHVAHWRPIRLEDMLADYLISLDT